MPLKHKCVNMPVVSDYLIHFQLPDLPGKLWDTVIFFMFLLAFIKCLLGQTKFLHGSFSPLAWAHPSEWPPGRGWIQTPQKGPVLFSMISGAICFCWHRKVDKELWCGEKSTSPSAVQLGNKQWSTGQSEEHISAYFIFDHFCGCGVSY